MLVQLYRAGIPFLGWLAAHYWFVVRDEQRCERWEVWQTKNAGGRSIGHLHCNLKPPEANCDTYRYWPGPNSNTYVAWVLREARVAQPLDRLAVGKSFPVS